MLEPVNLQTTVKLQKVSLFTFPCDLLYFVVFFRIGHRLNTIKHIFRTFYRWNETKNTSFVENYHFKNESCDICR